MTLGGPKEAESRLRQLAGAVSSAGQELNVERETFESLELQAREVAIAVFGPRSTEAKDLNSGGLRASHLARLERLSRSIRIIQRDGNVVHLHPSPAPDRSEYYRKQLSRLGEEIASMLLSLRDR